MTVLKTGLRSHPTGKRGQFPRVLTPRTNRKVTVPGALEVTTGAWVYRLGRLHRLPAQVLRACPQAPAIVVICDNDSIHHARTVTAYLEKHPGWNCCTAPGTARTTTRPGGSGPG